MKKLIRKGVFETNSSSSHSLSVSKDNNFDQTLRPDENGNIVLHGGEYGWEEEHYNNARDKVDYCIQDVYDQDYKRDMLIKVIKEHTGCNEVILDHDSIDNGYIDHQSRGTTNEAFTNEKTLKNFLFNSGSMFETDNDNH